MGYCKKHDAYNSKMTSAELIFDQQHGPIVTVHCANKQISVYLIAETGTVTNEDGTGYGIEVKGDWVRLRKTMHGPNGSTAQEEQSKRAETYKSAYRAGWNDALDELLRNIQSVFLFSEIKTIVSSMKE